MKLSNKVLIGFFGFIFVYMTAAFTEIRFRGTPNFIDFANSIPESVDISAVTYLVVEDLGHSVSVIGSDKARLEIHSGSGDLLQKLKYKVSGDTLTLRQLTLEKDQRIRISVHIPNDSLKGLMINNAMVDIKNLQQKELSIFQNAGRINMYGNNKLNKLNLESINKAYFMLNNTNLEELSVFIEQSEVHIDVPVKHVEGSMKDDSYLAVLSAEEIQFKKDENSKLDLNW